MFNIHKLTIENNDAIFITDFTSGETGIMRSIKSKDELYEAPENLNTLIKLFEYKFEDKKKLHN